MELNINQPGTNPWSAKKNEAAHQASLSMKLGIVVALALLLLLPVQWVRSLIAERQERRQQVEKEVAAGWGDALTLTTPYLAVPTLTPATSPKGQPTKRWYLLLPETVNAQAGLEAVERQRSLFKVLLYKGDVQMHGQFGNLPATLGNQQLLWGEARLCLAASSLRGFSAKPVVRLGNQNITLERGLPVGIDSMEGFSAALAGSDPALWKQFSLQLPVKGAGNLALCPTAGQTQWAVSGAWNHPSYNGYQLPDTRVNAAENNGRFGGQWKFNQTALKLETLLPASEFDPKPLASGVKLVQPAGDYEQTERMVKYAILFLGLTLGLWFGAELLQSRPVHPVQYALVGLALVIFYTLLLSISEVSSFKMAYGISALATAGLITTYAWGHFKQWKPTASIGAALSGLYVFIFVLVQLEDYALLTGSIALFLLVALAMYLSRKVNWYGAADQPIAATPKPQII